MPIQVLPKYQITNTVVISLASLAHSIVGVGRQANLIDNTGLRYQDAQVSVSIKLSSVVAPTAYYAVYIYLIRSDNAGTPIITDGAGASDAGITIKAATLIGVLPTGPSPAMGDFLKENYYVTNIGPKWTIAIVNSSGTALDTTPGNHVINYFGLNPEIQT